MLKLLLADLGGTQCRFAIANIDIGHADDFGRAGISFLAKVSLQTKDYADIEDLLFTLISDIDFNSHLPPCSSAISGAVLAVAGTGGQGNIFAPNMGSKGWSINVNQCAKVLGIKNILLMNDFVAQAFAAMHKESSKAELLWHGEKQEVDYSQNIAVLGAGTGFGMCLLLPKSKGRFCRHVPSEGGHTSFPFENKAEWDFANFVRQELAIDTVLVDHVLGGVGLRLLHKYFYNEELLPAQVAQKITPTSMVLDLYAGFYGRACKNYVLYSNAWGGLYITGGIAIQNPFLVKHHTFAENFYKCKAYGHLLQQVPIFLYKHLDSGLLGVAIYALHQQSYKIL